MPRVKTASGKRELIGVRLSESAKQAVDAARGDLSPSEWARGLIEAELARLGISSAPLADGLKRLREMSVSADEASAAMRVITEEWREQARTQRRVAREVSAAWDAMVNGQETL